MSINQIKRRLIKLWMTALMACLYLLVLSGNSISAQTTLRALIVDGQNNHGNWPDTSKMMKSYLEENSLFQVDTATTINKGTDENFQPDFAAYDVVVSNYNGAPWPDRTKTAFEKYMRDGGGLVIVHAADNAFPKWKEFNEMIGLGGWGGRNQTSGPYLYFDDKQKEFVRDTRDGRGGNHGRQHPFRVIVRDSDHPITKGMPGAWMHVKDELYDRLRGPANNIKVLATAYSDPSTGGSGRHEPILFVVEYGKGRVFHTPMGHSNASQQCVGFITALQRGAQWAATGKVTTQIPDDFPTVDETRSRETDK